VAQLGARFHGMEEVIGSIPIRSTNFPKLPFDFRVAFCTRDVTGATGVPV
jgi:hypothetical protein